MTGKVSVPLTQLKEGQRAMVSALNMEAGWKKRLNDLGLTEGTWLTRLQASPFGDPVAYLLRGAVFALRREDAERISVWVHATWVR